MDQITVTNTDATTVFFKVYYGVENRQKRIEWVSGTTTVNRLYSALQDLFDELSAAKGNDRPPAADALREILSRRILAI